jgi:hypothetical protein
MRESLITREIIQLLALLFEPLNLIIIFDAGFPITHTSDADLHLHTVRHNGDATTSYQIDSGTPVVGDAGAEEYNFGTFFCNTVATGSYLTGSMGRFLLFDEELSDAEVAFIQTLLLPN